MLNVATLIGRLGADPNLRYTNSGKAVCQFRIAVDRGTKDASGEKETDWFDIIVWDKQGENCSQFLSKGKMVGVSGRLQVRQYDAQDGTRRTVVEVVARDVQFLSPKDANAPHPNDPQFDEGGPI